jgi:hypothetical protein
MFWALLILGSLGHYCFALIRSRGVRVENTPAEIIFESFFINWILFVQLLRKKSKESLFSIDNDASFYTSRGMGEIPAEVYRCEVPAKILGNFFFIK